MSHWKRLLIEIVVVLAVALAGYGAWWWCSRQAARGQSELSASYEARIDAVEASCERWAGAMAAKQAEAALRSFAAGLYPALIADAQGQDLDIAVGAFLELPGVEFAHLLSPDGTVLASSDRKFTILGDVSGRADWALGVTELATRPGEKPDTLELAAPILSSRGTEAIVWIGYGTKGVAASCKPAALSAMTEKGKGAAAGSAQPQ